MISVYIYFSAGKNSVKANDKCSYIFSGSSKFCFERNMSSKRVETQKYSQVL